MESLSELGVCLLLFGVGLEVDFRELLDNVRAAIAGLLSMVMLCGCIVFLAVFLTHTPFLEALCIALFASMASTPVSLGAIGMGDDEEKSGRLSAESGVVLSILIIQDIGLACLLAGMPLLFKPQQVKTLGDSAHSLKVFLERQQHHQPGQAGAAAELDWRPGAGIFRGRSSQTVAAVLAAQVLFCLLLFSRRRMLKKSLRDVLARLEAVLLSMNGESFTLMALTYVFALSWFVDRIGLSEELGAFVAGLVLTSASKPLSQRAEQCVGGLKDTFVAWFFASIGLVVNPRFLFDNLRGVLSVAMFIFIMKLMTGFLPLWLLAERRSPTPALSALRASWILAHISEFGFVLASKGSGYGVLSRHVYLLLVGANSISLCLAPWLFKVREILLPEVIPHTARATLTRKMSTRVLSVGLHPQYAGVRRVSIRHTVWPHG